MTGAVDGSDVHILPYSHVVGQAELKLALELNYIAPRIGGVLISGQRGTAKSTVVRAFSLLTGGELPVTLPINATDDRVLGGWELDALMRGEARTQPGLLEEAGEKGMLYIDEVNLLDDHIVNIILDVVSTGVLSVQREAIDTVRNIAFGLVGTMNPEEGGLRPQLLDRFGLMVAVSELDQEQRRAMVLAVLRFDDAAGTDSPGWPKDSTGTGSCASASTGPGTVCRTCGSARTSRSCAPMSPPGCGRWAIAARSSPPGPPARWPPSRRRTP